MIHLFRWRQVPVLAHWSVPALGAFVLLSGWRKIHVAVAAVAAYLAVILLHEIGHALLARRMLCRVVSISLYPIHGVCRYIQPGSAYAEAVIAWGGVLAQFVVAVPIAVYLAVFGYTPFAPANALLAILSLFSLGQALST